MLFVPTTKILSLKPNSSPLQCFRRQHAYIIHLLDFLRDPKIEKQYEKEQTRKKTNVEAFVNHT